MTTPVDGVYLSVDPAAPAPAGWVFKDSLERGGAISTQITAPNGATGSVLRKYDPATNQWVMLEAFFGKDMPNWIETGIPMVAGKGTPLIAFLDMRVMKSFGIAYGSLKSTKLSTIQNVEAVCQLEVQVRKGVAVDDAVRTTHSVNYAETELVQSGHQIVNAKVSGGRRMPIDGMLRHYERSGFRTPAEHDAILAKYGISRTDVVLWDYDIHLELAPFPVGGTP